MKARWAVFILFLILSVHGTEAQSHRGQQTEILNALNTATNVTLYSVDPGPRFGGTGPTGTNDFQGYRVIGSMPLSLSEAKYAASAFRRSVEDWAASHDRCTFQPRHGLRYQAGGHKYDFLLSYSCGDISIFKDNAQVDYFALSDSPTALNDLLARAHIPLAPHASY